MTASFTKDDLAVHERSHLSGEGALLDIKDLETSNIRPDLDESAIDNDDDHEDLQRSHPEELKLVDMTHHTHLENAGNDGELRMTQLQLSYME
jgi:hypothetical protein